MGSECGISTVRQRTYSSTTYAFPICDRTWEKGPIDVVNHFLFFYTNGKYTLFPLRDTRVKDRSVSVAELQRLKHEEL